MVKHLIYASDPFSHPPCSLVFESLFNTTLTLTLCRHNVYTIDTPYQLAETGQKAFVSDS